jgi:prepilin-type N-terminal cleavage/methylation domain-containing protein
MTQWKRQRGFTLVELMVALVVSSIVVLGIFAFGNIQRSNASVQEKAARIQESLEGAMWAMGQDVRQSGLGFTRQCTELRVWDGASGQLVNPGGPGNPVNAVLDAITGDPYWVLRDGVQAHWNSTGAAAIDGGLGSSARPGSAADSFDVILGEGNYLGAAGVFVLDQPLLGGETSIGVRTAISLDSSNPTRVAEVQQLFPPGTFVLLMVTPGAASVPLSPLVQRQCVLLQVTDDVQPGIADDLWIVPIDATSAFNDVAGLMADTAGDDCGGKPAPCTDDWDPAAFAPGSASIVPLGRLRWSRYEIDYTLPTLPYLVRYDIIGYQAGVDPGNLGSSADYPHCAAGTCPMPQLHLPGTPSPPTAVAIGPIIEDMQVAVGCDGWLAASAVAPMPVPDVGFEELGPAVGATAGIANNQVDENSFDSGERNADEWLGNAVNELSAPDCVYYGSAEVDAADWVGLEPTPPPSRMSPTTLRISLVGSAETVDATGGLATLDLAPLEDRLSVPSLVGLRQRLTLTERFTPDNARWRDPLVR